MGCSNSSLVTKRGSDHHSPKQVQNGELKERKNSDKLQPTNNVDYTKIGEHARKTDVKTGYSNSTLETEGKSGKSSKQAENGAIKERTNNDKVQPTSNVDYTMIDEHARKAPTSLKNSVKDLVAYLSKPTKDHKLVARAIFVWISNNIEYDVSGFFGRTKMASCDAEDVMKGGKSVCEGYANVMETLCREAGIPVKKISGFAKGFGHSADSEITTDKDTNHAWNAIQVGNKWHLVDSTWGAGHLNTTNEFKKEFDEFYFLTNPKQFVYSHFPYMGRDMEESLKWQLLEKPVKLEEFNKLVMTKPRAFKLGVQPVSHKNGVIRVKQEVELSFKCTGEAGVTYTTMLQYMEGNTLYKKPRNVFDQLEDGLFKVKVHPHRTGTFHLNIFGRQTDEEGSFHQLFEYVLKSEEVSDDNIEYPQTYIQVQTDRCILKQPLQYKLKQNTAVEFCITSPYLNRVMVNKTFLEKTGETFRGVVKTGSNGEALSVYGSRNNEGSLAGLYKFEIV